MTAFSVNLSGHHALVTGAGAGCGRAIALALAEHGAAVAVNDLNIERAESLAQEIQDKGGQAVPLRADISNRFQTASMIEQTRDAFGRIHILVSAAGIFKAEPMLNIDEWEWRRQIEVNITGVFFCMQLVGRVMADEGGGRIINLTSTASYAAAMGHAAGKTAVIGMTRQAARELASKNIMVNAIAAGGIQENDRPPIQAKQTLRKRVGQAALFLCSDAADLMTGQTLVVDGGQAIIP